MITYGFSVQGKSHIKKGIVCQDAYSIQRLKNDCYLLAAADGVGSAEYSDIGSKLAVEKLAEYCHKYIEKGISQEKQLHILECGYEYAMQSIQNYAENNRGNIASYDTTLSAAIYDGKRVVFGHAGDGGIIAKTVNGSYQMITERQKGADSISVRPLRAGKQSWSFGVFQEETVAVLIATDGILDGVMAPWLLNLPKVDDPTQNSKKNRIYVSAAEFFMNEDCVLENNGIENPEQFMNYFLLGEFEEEDKKRFTDCLLMGYQKLLGKKRAQEIVQTVGKNYIPIYLLQEITDDKTVVCAINARRKGDAMPSEYYHEPDWRSLNELYHEIFYPGRVKKNVITEKEGNNDKKTECDLSNVIQEDSNIKRRRKWVESLKPEDKKDVIHIGIDVLLCLVILILSLIIVI